MIPSADAFDAVVAALAARNAACGGYRQPAPEHAVRAGKGGIAISSGPISDLIIPPRVTED